MARIAVVYHSGFGHTAKQAEAVARGAAGVPGAEVRLIPVEKAKDEKDFVNAADAIVMGCPTYMGSASAPFKAWMDETSKVWMKQGWKDKLAAGFTNSGSWSGDKLSTLLQLFVFAMQHGMVWAGLDLMPGFNSSKGSIEDLNRLGFSSGAAAQSNVDAPPDQAPPPADLKTAEHLGRRVAEAAARWRRGAA